VSIVEDAHAIGQLVFFSAETYVYHEARATQELSAVSSNRYTVDVDQLAVLDGELAVFPFPSRLSACSG
jgi:hypothetical protein